MTSLDEISLLHIVKGIDIGGNSGGAENFGIRISRALKQRIQGVALCSFLRYNTQEEQYWLRQLQSEGIEVFFACSSEKVNLLEARRKLGAWIHDHKPKLVHSHYQVGTITCLTLKLVDGLDCLVRTAHANVEFGLGFKATCSRLLFREFLYPLLVDYEIGVSHTITDDLNHQALRRLVQKPSHWIPNALPDSDQAEPEGNTLAEYINDCSEPPWLITTMGVIVRSKNFDMLVKMMPEVIKAIPQAKLVIVGGGPEYGRLVDLSRQLNVSNSCWFLGQQRYVNSILLKSDVFILPSTSEGFSTVLLEAMKNKVPVIASNIAGNRELIQDNISGKLVSVGDTHALVDTILWAYHQPHKMKIMAQVAFDQISPYNITSVCEKYIEAYSSLLNSRRDI
jgi:glycosyltransferase involved in cell wall biosynthesis